MKVGVQSLRIISEEVACCFGSGRTTIEEEARAKIVKMPRNQPPAKRMQSPQVEGTAGARPPCREVA